MLDARRSSGRAAGRACAARFGPGADRSDDGHVGL